MEAGPHPSSGQERRRTDRALRVLVVDDDRDTVTTLTTLLELEGHIVQGILSGTEVLPAVRFFRPDAIVLDLSVPGISGYAVAQAIRFSFTDVRRPLLIAMSGMWQESADRMVAQQVGFDHYLVKPVEPAELLKLIEGLRRP